MCDANVNKRRQVHAVRLLFEYNIFLSVGNARVYSNTQFHMSEIADGQLAHIRMKSTFKCKHVDGQ